MWKIDNNITIDVNVCEKLIVEFYHKSFIEEVFSGEYSIKPIWDKWEEWEGFLWNRSIFKISYIDKKFSYSPEASVTNKTSLYNRIKKANFN